MAGFFVMQTPIASCLIQMSALSFSPLSLSLNPNTRLRSPSSLLTPDFSPLCVFPSFSSPSKSSVRAERASGALGGSGRPLSWGSACFSVHGAVSRPDQVYFIFKCYNQAPDPQGALYGCGPRLQGQDGDLIAPAEERSGGAK